jgi:lipopolysaccharide export LptBFGC system permease protein LptF
MSLKSRTTDLSATIKAKLTLSEGAIDDKVAYADSLPDTISEEQVLAVRAFDKEYTPAFTHAAQAIAFDSMKEDKASEQVRFTTDMLGGDSFTGTINRQRTFPIPTAKGEEKKDDKVVYGATTVSLNSAAGKNAGELKKVLTHGKELFSALAEG